MTWVYILVINLSIMYIKMLHDIFVKKTELKRLGGLLRGGFGASVDHGVARFSRERQWSGQYVAVK